MRLVAANSVAGDVRPTQNNYIAIDRTKKYRVKFWARPSTNNTAGQLYFSLRQFINDSGASGPVNSGRSPYKPSGTTVSTHNSTYGANQWGEYSYLWDSSDWQTGVYYFKPEFLDNYNNQAGHWDIQALSIKEETDLEDAKATIAVQGTSLNGLEAQYTVKIDNNGHVSGYGLASTVVNGIPTATFQVNANAFVITDPSATASDVSPFSVISGVTYIDTAMIRNGTITTAKIGNAQITDAKIGSLSATKLTAGTIDASNINISGTSSSALNITSAASGARTVYTSTGIEIYDTSGLRVKLGLL